MRKENRFQNVPKQWFVFLPLLGAVYRVFGQMGWLREGSWLNLLFLFGIVFIWLYVVLKETNVPFSPLVWMGAIYGLLIAGIDVIIWFLFRKPLGLEKTGWSFDDLLYAITYSLTPIFQLLGNVLFGLLLGMLMGFTASMIQKFQQKRR